MESAVAVLVILGTPVVGSHGISFQIVDNILVRLLLLVTVVFSIRQGAMPGLLTFLAVYTLLLERNHQLLTLLPNQAPQWPSNNYGTPIQAAAPLVGLKESIAYEPHDSQDTHPMTDHPIENSNHDKSPQGESPDIKVLEAAEDLRDNIPRLEEAPHTDDAPSFYNSRNL